MCYYIGFFLRKVHVKNEERSIKHVIFSLVLKSVDAIVMINTYTRDTETVPVVTFEFNQFQPDFPV